MDGDGFLKDLSLGLSPELNVLIGGRGVGKSAVLEVLRYGLDLPEYWPTEYRKELVHHALGSGGKVIVYLRHVVQPGVERRYRIEREWEKKAQVYEQDASGEHLVELSVTDLISEGGRPFFFGQRELYEVAQRPELRRQFLDDLIGSKARQKKGEIMAIMDQLKRNASRLRELWEKRSQREEVEQRLKEIEHEIRLFEQHGLVEKLAAEMALARDEERLQRIAAIPGEFMEEWLKIRERWLKRLEEALADLSLAESPQRDLLRQDVGQAINELHNGLEAVFQQGSRLLEKLDGGLQVLIERWRVKRRELDEELRLIRKELGRETLDANHLIRLTREKERFEHKLKLLRQAEDGLKNLEEERHRLLQKLRDARDEAFRLRKIRADEITRQIGDRVKVEVLRQGQRKEYAEKVVDFFKGSKIHREDLAEIANNKKLLDGIELAKHARNGEEELVKRTGLSQTQAQRMINFLDEDEARWHELELLAPDDDVRVYLKVDRRWVPLEHLSAGQKATAMLLILLTQEQYPLIIDQPEDDLDNRFIYKDIVTLLRKQKGRRQIIFATHNPNIPVLAHAELIVALEAEHEQAHLSIQGGMDKREVQDEVRKVMEGGDEAFRRRAEKYGWI